ncbi:MAG TPA: hypothetical protein VFB66_14585 [Tepidisphaeraceae bacterium]|nr:hypothetical protein [Tepidisphaeraceae bacterium]
MNPLRSGRLYQVTGASSQTGEDVEITVEAHDEADAARAANRQGVFVSGCKAAGADGSTWASAAARAAPEVVAPAAASMGMTFAETVAGDPVVQRLVRTFPGLGSRVDRLNEEDRAYLSDLVGEKMGVSHRDSAHVRRLMDDAG